MGQILELPNQITVDTMFENPLPRVETSSKSMYMDNGHVMRKFF